MTQTITIDRDARDALYAQVQYDAKQAEKIGFAIQDGDRGNVCRLLTQATLWRDLLDVIGWAKEDDRDSYEIPTGGPLSDWLEGALNDMRKIVGEDQAMLLVYQEERSARDADSDTSMEELIAQTSAIIDEEEQHARELLGVLELLGDLGWGAGMMTSAQSLRELSDAVRTS
jgi:hypothetical protein